MPYVYRVPDLYCFLHVHIDESATDLIVDDRSFCPGDTVIIQCIAKNTSFIHWSSSTLLDGISDVYCTQNGMSRRIETVNGVSIVHESEYYILENGTSLLSCNLTFQVNNFLQLRNTTGSPPWNVTCINNALLVGATKVIEISKCNNNPLPQ